MVKIPLHPWVKLLSALTFLLVFTGCTVLGVGSEEPTPAPAPTSSVPGMQVTSPKACLVAEQGMIRAEEPQGDLISWSPVTDSVAYIAATEASSWNVGELSLLSALKFDHPLPLASGAAGEILWSPDGSTIAYLGLRRSDSLYTIGLAYPDDRPAKDLFPGDSARTDDYSSQKSTLEWLDAGRLRVMVSCGMDCMEKMDISVDGGISSLVGIPTQRTWGMWSAHTHQPVSIPDEYASLPGQLNWSWDEQHIAYIDEQDNAWIINVKSGSLYPLDIGQYGAALETDWSYDDQYLAVQVDRSIKIFSFSCP
jgi:hypothetical protein